MEIEYEDILAMQLVDGEQVRVDYCVRGNNFIAKGFCGQLTKTHLFVNNENYSNDFTRIKISTIKRITRI